MERVRLVVGNYVPVLQPHADQSGISDALEAILGNAAIGLAVPASLQTPGGQLESFEGITRQCFDASGGTTQGHGILASRDDGRHRVSAAPVVTQDEEDAAGTAAPLTPVVLQQPEEDE